MRYNRILHRIAALLLGGLALGSCIYDHLDDGEPEIESPFTDGYSINVMLTLDNMGGTRAETTQRLKTFENYIDPEKCRVLFFDNQDRFLFESKSRWVKQLTAGGEESWLVSVPMYAYGNDVDERWRWQQIRKVMMEEEDENKVSFKIAILVNRPSVEVYPDLETEDKDGGVRESTNFDNSGPHWKVEDTRFGGTLDASGNNPNCKKIFDLHHTQEDPIYRDKGAPTSGNNKWVNTGLDHFYGHVMETQQIQVEENGKITNKTVLTMSSTSSWVDYGNTNDDDSPRTKLDGTTKRRAARTADTNYPIPMYGVQNFGKIENWVDGVPFNLSNFTKGNDASGEYTYKSIALLRSVVKLELLIPKRFTNGTPLTPDIVTLMYSNVYARCEPMDVWTPTEELWEKGAKHDDRSHAEDCEWFTLQKYARMVQGGLTSPESAAQAAVQGTLRGYPGDITGGTNDSYNLNAYRRRLSWFYGVWLEKGWPFEGVTENNNGTGRSGQEAVKAVLASYNNAEPPHIFNPCIQRNNYVIVDNENLYTGFSDDGTYYHYVVYTGERNQIDPNYLYRVDAMNNAEPTIVYWNIAINGIIYAFPITRYEEPQNVARNLNIKDNLTKTYNNTGNGTTTLTMPGNHARISPGSNKSAYGNEMVEYGMKYNQAGFNPDLLPWPLMRNHHYKITIGGITRADDGELEFSVSSEVNCSETLERNPAPAPAPEKPAKE